MKTFFAFLVLFAIHHYALAGLETDIPIANRVILESKPWRPTPLQTQQALASIHSFLSKPGRIGGEEASAMKEILAQSRNYRVQFVGMICDGRKIILCNFFPAAAEGKIDVYQDWRKVPIVVDDGGFHYWWIQYDSERDACAKFWVNGEA